MTCVFAIYPCQVFYSHCTRREPILLALAGKLPAFHATGASMLRKQTLLLVWTALQERMHQSQARTHASPAPQAHTPLSRGHHTANFAVQDLTLNRTECKTLS
jgi:hypothetical protein